MFFTLSMVFHFTTLIHTVKLSLSELVFYVDSS